MKTKRIITFIIASVISYTAWAQDFPMDAETQKITYTEVVTADGVSKDELSQRAAEWSKKNTKVEDNKAEGRYVSKSSVKVKYPAPMRGFFHYGDVTYKITISCKDGKYKYEITEFVHSSSNANGGKLESKLPECGKFTLTEQGWGVIKTTVKTEMPKIIEALKTAMSKPSPAAAAKSKDNW